MITSSKQSDIYKLTRPVAWSTIAGSNFFLLGMAGFLYLMAHAMTHGRGVPSTGITVIFYATAGALGFSIVFMSNVMTQYITQVYGISAWRQSLRWRSTNLSQGKAAFSASNIKRSARLVGLRPDAVMKTLYVLICIDAAALAVGLIAR